MTEETCDNCRFFRLEYGVEQRARHNRNGMCLRYPPYRPFPMTEAMGWCGEWEGEMPVATSLEERVTALEAFVRPEPIDLPRACLNCWGNHPFESCPSIATSRAVPLWEEIENCRRCRDDFWGAIMERPWGYVSEVVRLHLTEHA